MKARKRARVEAKPTPIVVLVGDGPAWQPAIGTLLALDGYRIDWVDGLDAVLSLLERGTVQALLVAARPLAASDLLLLRRIREASPRTAVVAVTNTPTDPDLKRAFESGATAFLSWPSSADALRHAIEREDLLASRGFRMRPGLGPGHGRREAGTASGKPDGAPSAVAQKGNVK